MRSFVCLALALAAALVVAFPRSAQAQGQPLTFRYHDADGDGRLSLLDLGADDATGGRQIKISLSQNGISYSGSGITYPLQTTSPYTTLITFSLVSPRGESYFFQGKLISGITLSGQGTYHPTTPPDLKAGWSIVLGG